jgi:hypothetical protein
LLNGDRRTDGTSGFFASAISGTSDVDRDGFDDVVITTPNARSNTGRVHVDAGDMATPLTREMHSLDGPDGLKGYFGWDVSLVGDVDGNGTAISWWVPRTCRVDR